MSTRTRNTGNAIRPIAVGTGLLALDVIYTMENEESVGRWAGKRELHPCKTNWLLIETLGPEGLRFRSRLPSYHNSEWQHIPCFPVSNYKDTAGAGDWCTAGIIACLGAQGAEGMERVGKGQLRDVLRQSQLLASWNGGFEGARGGMDATHREQLKNLVLGISPAPPFFGLKSRRSETSSMFEVQRNSTRKAQCLSKSCHLI